MRRVGQIAQLIPIPAQTGADVTDDEDGNDDEAAESGHQQLRRGRASAGPRRLAAGLGRRIERSAPQKDWVAESV